MDVGARVSTRDVDGVAVVRVAGDLDIATADDVLAAVAGAPRGHRGMVLDLGGVGFVDSSGLRVLLEAESRCRGEGVRLAIVSSPRVDRTLAMVGLSDRFARLAHAGDASGWLDRPAGG